MDINKETTKRISRPQKRFLFSKRMFFLILSLTFLAILSFIAIDHLNNQSSNLKTETTSKQPSAQTDFADSKDKGSAQTVKNEGIVTDSNGNIDTIPPESSWIKSRDDVISVYSPTSNSILKTNDVLSGQTSAPSINFRLIDSISGEIAQGKISVVDGKFSGIFNFSTTATEGRLDIYTASDNGVESSVIEIPVRFNQ